MKRIILLIIGIVAYATIFAATPNAIKYQAIARNASGEVIMNQEVGFQLSILKGSTSGSIVYTEEHKDTTNSYGLVNLLIGKGTTSDDLYTIDWANGPYFIKIEMDANGGTSYSPMGISQLVTVPYALHSNTADSLVGGISETDPTFSGSPAAGISPSDITNWDDAASQTVSGNESAFDEWDKNSSDDFDGDYNSLNNKPDLSDTANYANQSALEDTASNIRNDFPDVSSFITSESQNLDQVLTQNNSAGNNNIKDLAEPVSDNDAATKAYVDALLTELQEIKIAVGILAEDIDGNLYETVTIGSQVWLAENLKTTKLNDGTPIDEITGNTAWIGASDAAYCWYDNDSANYAEQFGALYNWYAVNSGALCPTGWHVPTDADWQTLEIEIGMDPIVASNVNFRGTDEGGKLKETGTSNWASPNTGATNASGFTATPNRTRSYFDGDFTYNDGTGAYFWSSTEYSADNIYYRSLSSLKSQIYRKATFHYHTGGAVRCVKD